MTGVVTWEVLLWIVSAFAAAAAGAGAVAGVAWRMFKARDDALATARRELDLKIEAVDARAKVAEQTLTRSLTEYQLHVAETFATKVGVTQALDRVEQAVDRLSQQLDGVVDRLSTRLDRLAESRAPPPRSRGGS